MVSYNQVTDPFIEWSRAAFAEEIEIGFKRAKVFDAPVTQVLWLALEEFSAAQLRILGRVLPMGPVVELRNTFNEEEKQLTQALIAARDRIWESHQQEIGEQMEQILKKPVREEAKKILGLAGGIFKEIAQHWDYEIRKVEPTVWMLTRSEPWGSISVPFDLYERIEFSYHIRMESSQVSGLPKADTYLGRLGLSGRSACKVVDASTCEEKFRKVAELIHWQLGAYGRIMKSISGPGFGGG